MGNPHFKFPKPRPRATGRRKERIAQSVKRELAFIISRDAQLEEKLPSMTSIASVSMSGDFHTCTVYISTLKEGASSEAAKVLGYHSAILRARLSGVLNLRRTPQLRFKGDNQMETGARIDDILASVKAEESSPQNFSAK